MTSRAADSVKSGRYYDLDWLRVFATLAVFLYHAARPFDDGGWHIKNVQVDPLLDFWTGFLGLWIMPLLFVVSGASIALSLRSRRVGQFARERLTRLLVPLILGIFVLAPPQVYLERIGLGMFRGTFFDFFPHYFDGLYLGIGETGNFAWMGLHLWYLLMLFIFSLLLLPLFAWLRNDGPQTVLKRIGAALERPGVIFLAALPLILLAVTLDPEGPGLRAFGGWNIFVYMLLLVYGFVVMSGANFEKVFFRYRWWALVISLAAGFVANQYSNTAFGTLAYAVDHGSEALVSWGLIVALFGFFYPLRSRSSAFLRYTSELVLPYYMLHQTVIVILGYFILQLDAAPLVKYALILAASFPVIMGLYEVVIRHVNPLRFLFGLKPLSRATQQPPVLAANRR